MVRSLFKTFYNLIFIIVVSLGIFVLNPNLSTADTSPTSPYQQQEHPSPDGIGKYYMGREIARFMGYTGASWLERPKREAQEKPNEVIGLLNLKPNNVVADIGAGTGYFTFRIASLVPQGKVLAVDIQTQMLEIIGYIKQDLNITNVEPVLAIPNNPNLPEESIDLALMVDAYHEFEYPQEMMKGIIKALKPGGRVVLVEYRGENPFIPIQRLHKMTQKQVTQEMQTVGLVWRGTEEVLPSQHYMVFEKPQIKSDVKS
ncbi:class I SAM-dependent methyltransferase [Anabaena sp. UHCC 0204]|uniref:class I SAM-dependent methyltransferase n=1 Tax=Anabaena sp. UHCC 0204 TaxID=2590009 RepID=UPI00144677E6|nr:methyltransferase domain-containing protein [Anabaena sp. UHCC 0204]MTJ06820.1 class I SAM-dependent methyltransferase [Anabaena sp. UHCC 0204]